MLGIYIERSINMTAAINNNRTKLWKRDVIRSVDFYNNWFLNFAPDAYRSARNAAIDRVDAVLIQTKNFSKITEATLKRNPEVLGVLRMATAPPIARERLVGLAGVSKNLVEKMEMGEIPKRMPPAILDADLKKIISMIERLLDVDIFSWIKDNKTPSATIRRRAASIVADRVCGAVADPIIRNEQEKRQLAAISAYLNNLGYKYINPKAVDDFRDIPAGHYSYHFNVSVSVGSNNSVNIPIDVVIMRQSAKRGDFPILIECKSAGDFTNTNKRRKEEAVKITQLKNTYGKQIEFMLFLCGYFDSGYLGYEAAEGIDWIWEHRISDFSKMGI